MSNTELENVREAVAVFQSENDLQAAIDDLLTHGFDRAEISLLASVADVDQKLGPWFHSLAELEDDPDVPTTAYIPVETIGDAEGAVIGGLMYVGALVGLIPVVASGGALAAAIAAVALGGGGGAAIGTVLARMIGQHHADYIEEQLELGGLILWVRTWNRGDEHRAVKILSAHAGADVHLHGLPNEETDLDSHAEEFDYRGETYQQKAEHEFYAGGKLFASEQEVKAYLDRHVYLEDLYTQSRAQKFDLDAALISPVSVFKTPQKLIASSLPKRIKIELLKRWAYDTKELEMAADDGMPVPRNGDRRQEIMNAIDDLEMGQAA